MLTEQMPAAEELEPKKEITPEDVEFLQDSLRVADTIVKVYEGKMRLLDAENFELRKKLHTDELTGANNEEGFRESAERRKAESGPGFVLMYLDANKFKPINDEFGHAAGDFVLKEIANHLQGMVRGGDIVARLHGDEFAVIFTGATEEMLREKFEIEKIEFTVDFEGKNIPVSLSAGFATHQEGETIEDLLRRADAALLIEKKKRGDSR
jgi:diguanylate cyclase (GGDEF)-like protein